MSDESFVRGLKQLGPVTITVDFSKSETPAYCAATPCPVCGACAVCKDFHDYTGRGCTEDSCPYQLNFPVAKV